MSCENLGQALRRCGFCLLSLKRPAVAYRPGRSSVLLDELGLLSNDWFRILIHRDHIRSILLIVPEPDHVPVFE